VSATLGEFHHENAIFAIARHLPLTGLPAMFPIFLMAAFFLTRTNSATLSLAMFVSGHEIPGKNLRALSGLAPGAVANVLAATESLKAIQTALTATAFPPMLLRLIVIYGTFKGLCEYRELCGPQE
jgi:choline/glycine/proline betaine transport protein/glycine betaine transporter